MTLNPISITGLLLLSFPALCVGQQASDQMPELCPDTLDAYSKYSPPPIFDAEELEQTRLSAEEVQNIEGKGSIFSGNVLIEQHLLRLRADRVIHKPELQQLDLTGHVHVDTEGMSVNADEGWYNLGNRQGELLNTQFTIQSSQLSGTTPRLSLNTDRKTTLRDSRFSTCPPEKMDWYLDTDKLQLNYDTSTGVARHTTLWVKDIPVFYLPWIQFPLGDERRSGFLMPGFASSSGSGFEFNLPWYWNIAPNHDAVLTPRYLRERGEMLNTDYRYLTHKSRGEINIEYLHSDISRNDESRYLLHLDNQSKLNSNPELPLYLSLRGSHASDEDYLGDFGSNSYINNTSHLEKLASLKLQLDSWRFQLDAQSFQTVDPGIAAIDRPYRRMPQLKINGDETLWSQQGLRLNITFDGEWSDFQHESPDRIEGQRAHVYPKISLPYENSAGYIKPGFGIMSTRYTLDDNSSEHRRLTVASLDSGLWFERSLSDGKLIQTLEPRLYYLNIPYEEQLNLPLFDTSADSFSFASLFRENRFNGIDRIGDTDQLTMALSSRLIEQQSGEELFYGSIGRILYFEDQRVSLTNTVDRREASDYVAELGGKYRAWKARTTVQWNAESHHADRRSLLLNYAPSTRSIFNIGYRYYRGELTTDSEIEQTDISFAWPVSSHYSLLGRWNYSLNDERDINTLFGIEYESCCWALRLISQRYLTNNITQPYDTSVMFQLVLKGFGSISDKAATETLKHAILGYQSDF